MASNFEIEVALVLERLHGQHEFWSEQRPASLIKKNVKASIKGAATLMAVV